MKQKVINNIVICAILIILSLIFIFGDVYSILRFIFSGMGLLVIFHGVLNLLSLKMIHDEKEKTFLIIRIVLLFIVGTLLLVYPEGVINIIAGSLLLVIPIYKIIISNNKKEAFKDELIKIIIGIVIVVCGFGNIFNIVMTIMGFILGAIGLIYLVYNIILLIKLNSKIKKEDDSVIDV